MKRRLLVGAFGLLASFFIFEAAWASDVRSNSSRLSNTGAGVGLVIEIKDGHFIIKELVKGCPAWADKAIKVGDEIVKIKANGASDWVSTKGLSLKQVENLIQGEVTKPLFLELWSNGKKWVEILLREENC